MMDTPAWLIYGRSPCCDARWSYCYTAGWREKIENRYYLLQRGYWQHSCSTCDKEYTKKEDAEQFTKAFYEVWKPYWNKLNER